MKRIILTALLALVASAAFASPASPRASDLQLIEQLAMQPFAAVVGDRCEIRGAVWAGGPRAGVRVALIAPDETSITTITNKQGIFSVSVPYAGVPTAYREEILDDVRVRSSLVSQAQMFIPQIVCANELNAKTHSTSKEGI